MSNPLHQQVLDILTARMSPLNARTIVSKALRRAGLDEHLVTREHIAELACALAPGARLFLGADADVVLAAIAALAADSSVRGVVRCEVIVEADISLARRAAQAECMRAGGSGFTTQRVITIVSELGRNIVNYSRGGFVDVATEPIVGMARGKLAIIAQDTGPGFTNLEEILAGRYKSKTGLGKGLLGVKRMSTSFAIFTGPEGTRVEAEVTL
ncbi:MAG: ATP-binding protein [Deltaproteobacteria bacterium]|nr:ATP-binding protein [Deltaproteobacteria bacterium]